MPIITFARLKGVLLLHIFGSFHTSMTLLEPDKRSRWSAILALMTNQRQLRNLRYFLRVWVTENTVTENMFQFILLSRALRRLVY